MAVFCGPKSNRTFEACKAAAGHRRATAKFRCPKGKHRVPGTRMCARGR